MGPLTLLASRNGHWHLTFEDLKGLRAEGYIRDSTLDQRNGFAPSSSGEPSRSSPRATAWPWARLGTPTS